jgi:hypothetical protein
MMARQPSVRTREVVRAIHQGCDGDPSRPGLHQTGLVNRVNGFDDFAFES